MSHRRRWGDHAPRIRHRILRTEALESRQLLSASGANIPKGVASIEWNGEPQYAYTGRWILGLDGITGSAAQQFSAGKALMKGLDNTLGAKLDHSLGAHGAFLVKAPGEVSFADLEESLSGLPGFRYLEPDFMVSALTTTPNDTRYGELWGMNNTGQSGGTPDADIDAPEAWDLNTGSGSVVVGVIDTGVDYTHPDLAANIWTNPGEVPGDHIDNDNNGFVDDVHGYDFVNNDGDPMDDNNHGTHCSGTIGGTGNNANGVVGVNWHAQIMGLKFLGAGGSGAISDAVEAQNYAVMMKQDGVNIRLTSNSWGGGPFSQAMKDAIDDAADEDMLFIAAAGNAGSNNDVIDNFPSNYLSDNLIAVAATDRNDAIAGFSNFGLTTVDIGAPGVAILSTTRNNGYAFFNGTSMATPHVAGVAALAWSAAPGATYEEIRDAIYDGADPIVALNGITVTGARLNALGTLEELGVESVERFDFDSPKGPTTAAGRTSVLPTQIFAGDFGWETKTKAFVDKKTIQDPLLRDGHKGKDDTFRTQVGPGDYLVTVYLLDPKKAHDGIDVYAEGTLKIDDLDAPKGVPVVQSFAVTVAGDGILDVRFDGSPGKDKYFVLNGLDVATADVGLAKVGAAVPDDVLNVLAKNRLTPRRT